MVVVVIIVISIVILVVIKIIDVGWLLFVFDCEFIKEFNCSV